MTRITVFTTFVSIIQKKKTFLTMTIYVSVATGTPESKETVELLSTANTNITQPSLHDNDGQSQPQNIIPKMSDNNVIFGHLYVLIVNSMFMLS